MLGGAPHSKGSRAEGPERAGGREARAGQVAGLQGGGGGLGGWVRARMREEGSVAADLLAGPVGSRAVGEGVGRRRRAR